MRPLKQSLPLKLLMAREAVMERFRPHLNKAGVTEQQWRVLRALNEVEDMDAGALAAAISLHMPSLSRILVDLVERKLIKKQNGVDRRLRTVRITPQGRALVERLAPLSESEYLKIQSAIGADHYQNLMRSLEELISKLERD